MSTPQETPRGKHHAPESPTAGNGTGVPLVRLVNAGKRYGAVIALSDITMEVSAGEVTCVLGDNGAGKSTLIKIIAGLHQPSSGVYEVEGVGLGPIDDHRAGCLVHRRAGRGSHRRDRHQAPARPVPHRRSLPGGDSPTRPR